MKIDNVENFMQGQMTKAERRKEEDKRIKKAVSQMHAMIESEVMETLDKETLKAKERTEQSREQAEKKGENSEQASDYSQSSKKSDASSEMKRMLSKATKVLQSVTQQT